MRLSVRKSSRIDWEEPGAVWLREFACGFGKAPQALDSLPAPDAVFIGGTKGNLPEILSILLKKSVRPDRCDRDFAGNSTAGM